MTEENLNVSSDQDENVTIVSSPLPTTETQTASKLRESMQEFADIVAKVVDSDMADRDVFVLIRKSWRELRQEKLKVYPAKQKKRNRLKLNNKRKGIIKGKKIKNKREKK
jgi:uncharacterized protein (DUF39 family)